MGGGVTNYTLCSGELIAESLFIVKERAICIARSSDFWLANLFAESLLIGNMYCKKLPHLLNLINLPYLKTCYWSNLTKFQASFGAPINPGEGDAWDAMTSKREKAWFLPDSGDDCVLDRECSLIQKARKQWRRF